MIKIRFVLAFVLVAAIIWAALVLITGGDNVPDEWAPLLIFASMTAAWILAFHVPSSRIPVWATILAISGFALTGLAIHWSNQAPANAKAVGEAVENARHLKKLWGWGYAGLFVIYVAVRFCTKRSEEGTGTNSSQVVLPGQEGRTEEPAQVRH